MLYIYTPNLGLEITIFVLGREQGRFRGSREGARGSKGEQGGAGGSTKGARGARREREGSTGEHEGSKGARREQGSTKGARGRSTRGAAQGSLNWLPRNRL